VCNKFIFFLLSLNFGIFSLVAQPSSGIRGRVINSSTGGPLANVNIMVIGTKWGVATDTSGYYHIEHLPPGKYSVQASIIGFETRRAEELLSCTDKYVFEVAYEMGFSSEGNFTNWFKKRKGMTPREYRQQLSKENRVTQSLVKIYNQFS
jgi:hypothetical protein